MWQTRVGSVLGGAHKCHSGGRKGWTRSQQALNDVRTGCGCGPGMAGL